MSNTNSLKANQQKLEELKRKRQERLRNANQNSTITESRSEIKSERKEYSFSKIDNIHVSGILVETYDKDIQVAIEPRSLDSKAHKEIQKEEKEDHLLPREKRHKRDQKEKEHLKEVYELNSSELQSLVKSKHFTDFFNKSSKFLEKVLDHGDGDMIELLLRDGVKNKEKDAHDVLTHTLTFYDDNYTKNRVVTDFDWSSQINELFLASYSQNQESSIKDHVGVTLIWNPILKNRPEFYCFCQSAVTSAKFYPFSNSTVIGGCYNGQLVFWDMRVKSMPIQRSGISADAHKYPINSLNIIGTQISNTVASFSNDGMMCLWDVKQLSKPTKVTRLKSTKPARSLAVQNQARTSVGGSILGSRSIQMEASTASILDRTASNEELDINITCTAFPQGDANNYYLGSLNGVLYKNAMHNKSTDKITMFDQHNGPISGISVNYPSEYEALNNLVLTSSFDWTIKLWSPNSHKEALRTFQNSQDSEDYIYDVCWNPANPSIFASVNNQGYIDIFDLTRDLEAPITHHPVNKSSQNAQNKCKWNHQGSAILTGDSQGAINLFVLSEKYRRMEASKYNDLERYLYQSNEVM